MKKMLVGAAVLALATVVAPSANARLLINPSVTVTYARIDSLSSSAGDTSIGGCFFVTVKAFFLTDEENKGVIGDASETRDPIGNPTDATVTCKIEVNGVTQFGTTFAYSGITPPAQAVAKTATGLQAGVDQLEEFAASQGDIVSLCEDVHFADNSDTGWYCPAASDATVPAGLVPQLVDTLFVTAIDPVVCPILAAHPGTYGPVTIHPGGDLDLTLVDENAVYDCPPYRL